MTHVSDCIEATTRQKIQDNLTEEPLTDLFSQIDLEIESTTPKNRKRRDMQLKVTTALRLLTSVQENKKIKTGPDYSLVESESFVCILNRDKHV